MGLVVKRIEAVSNLACDDSLSGLAFQDGETKGSTTEDQER